MLLSPQINIIKSRSSLLFFYSHMILWFVEFLPLVGRLQTSDSVFLPETKSAKHLCLFSFHVYSIPLRRYNCSRLGVRDCSDNSRQQKFRRCIASAQPPTFTAHSLLHARGALSHPAEEVQLSRQPRRHFTVFDVEQAPLTAAAAAAHVPQILISRTVIFSIENPMTIKETA